MSIIIRLQNLPLSAKASDIREFFGDLKIPKGAVNIVGGLNGDAFIGFATDEDARLAMRHDGELLHNSKIRLMLSSRYEMDTTIANAHALAATTLNNKITETKLKVPQPNIEPIKQQSVNINENKQIINNEQVFEQTVPTYPINESWKNGIYSTNKERTKNNLQNSSQPISGFEVTSNKDLTSNYDSPQYLQNSKKNIYSQEDLYFATIKTIEKNGDAPIIPATTSNIVQEVNGYSGTITQHSYQQHFDSQPSLLPNAYSETYSKNYSQNLPYYDNGKFQQDLSNFNSNDGSSLVFNHNISQSINEGIKPNTNVNSLRATNVPDQNIFNFFSINSNSAPIKDDIYSENSIPSDIYLNQQNANAPVFPVTASIPNFSSKNSVNNHIKPLPFSNFGKTNKNVNEPPHMILEAATEDEMITRGELPATAFGAFSSNVAFGEKFIRRDGQAVSIAKDPFSRKNNTESFFNSNIPSTTRNIHSTTDYNRKMNNHRFLLAPPKSFKSSYNKMPYRNKRSYDNINGLNNTKPVPLLSLKFDLNNDDNAIPYDSWKSSSRSYKSQYPKKQMRKTEYPSYTKNSDKLPQMNSPVDTFSEN